MSYVTLASDRNGFLFSVDHLGQLNRLRIATEPGQITNGLGDVIGSGWDDVVSLVATRDDGQLVLVGATRDGRAVTAQTPVDGIATWSDVTPRPELQTAWNAPRNLRPGANKSILAIEKNGQLTSVPLVASGSGEVGLGAKSVLSGGWETDASAFELGGISFRIDANGNLRYNRGQDTWKGATEAGWAVLAPDPGGSKTYFPEDESSVFYIDAHGNLFRQRFIAPDDLSAKLEPFDPVKVGRGFIIWFHVRCEVEGYTDMQSVHPGSQVQFHLGLRPRNPTKRIKVPCTVEFVELRAIEPGHEADAKNNIPLKGAASLNVEANLHGCPGDWQTNGAQWPVTFSLKVPANTPSGFYAARVIDDKRGRAHIPFIVRPPAPTARLALLANTNTWNAYNVWGGVSRYRTTIGIETTLPFQRPHPGLSPELPDSWTGSTTPAGEGEWRAQVGHLLRAELWTAEWLLDNGYPFDVYTDEDLHTGRLALLDGQQEPNYAALILNAHPEYWTFEMHDTVKAFQAAGGSVVYLGGNVAYEVVRISGDLMEVFPDGTFETDRGPFLMRTLGKPEHDLVGVGFENIAGYPQQGEAYEVTAEGAAHDILKGTGLAEKNSLGVTSARPTFKAHGWELDSRRRKAGGGLDSPIPKTAVLAVRPGGALGAEMLFYQTGAGGYVFAASSLNFPGSLAVDAACQQIVRNVLDTCLAP
jgi:hypothetical protein